MSQGNLGGLQLINEIQAEIEMGFEPGQLGHCINWVDENYNNAWSDAIDAFDEALTTALDTSDYKNIRRAGETYKNEILGYIKLFKTVNQINSSSFMETLKNNSKLFD